MKNKYISISILLLFVFLISGCQIYPKAEKYSHSDDFMSTIFEFEYAENGDVTLIKTEQSVSTERLDLSPKARKEKEEHSKEYFNSFPGIKFKQKATKEKVTEYMTYDFSKLSMTDFNTIFPELGLSFDEKLTKADMENFLEKNNYTKTENN